MIQDILTLDEILFLIFIGVIIGLPLGWLLFSQLWRIGEWLHYYLQVRQRFKPRGTLRDFAGSRPNHRPAASFIRGTARGDKT